MNALDRKLELFAANEPDAAWVNEAQGKLDALMAARAATTAAVRPARRTRGWLAAAATAVVVTVAMLWLPFGSTPAVAFAIVQQHFRDFRTLRFDVEQRMNDMVVMKSRVNITRDGKVRTDVGDLVSVIVNSAERRVMTLHHPSHVATVTPLDAPVKQDDAMAWLAEIREFQGEAKALPKMRWIRAQRVHGWELSTAAGIITLWANDEGLPLEMTIEGNAAIELSFDFDFNPVQPAQMFSTEIPAGYSRGEPED